MSDAIQAELAELRRRLRKLEARAPIEAARNMAAIGLQIVRTNEALETATAPDPPRYWQGPRQEVVDAGTGDGGFVANGIQRTAHSPFMSKYAHDVAVLDMGHFQMALPTPMQMVFVRVESPSGPTGPFMGATAKLADIDVSAGTIEADPVGFGPDLPLMNSNPGAVFLGGSFPYFEGQILPAWHVWPTLDDELASKIAGVDKDDGFFICSTMPPGPKVLTKVGVVEGPLEEGDFITASIGLDGQGNVVDFTLVKT